MAQLRRRSDIHARNTGKNSRRRTVGGKRPGAGRWGSAFIQCQVCQHPERSRVDYLIASGTAQAAIARQYGFPTTSLNRHWKMHVSERYKQMVGASHIESFDTLLANATAANSESVDTLNLLVRGHSQMWALAMEAADHKTMGLHASRILQALEIRCKITLELAPSGNLTVNNFLMRDAAELVNTLRGNEDAVTRIEQWYQWRTQDKLIEAEIERAEVDQAAE
jgi:hypothetical protein